MSRDEMGAAIAIELRWVAAPTRQKRANNCALGRSGHLAGEEVEDVGVHGPAGGVQVRIHVAGDLEEAGMVRHHVRQQPGPHLRTLRGCSFRLLVSEQMVVAGCVQSKKQGVLASWTL